MHILFSVSIRFVCHFVVFLCFSCFFISRQFCVFIIASNALLFHLEICYKKKPFLALKRLFPFGIRHLTPVQTDDVSKNGKKLETIYCSSLIQICLQVLFFPEKIKLPYYLPHSGWSVSGIMTCHHQIPDNEYDATFPQNNWVDFEYITLTNEIKVQQFWNSKNLRKIFH